MNVCKLLLKNEKIFCIPDRKGNKYFYMMDAENGSLVNIANEKDLKKCNPRIRRVLQKKCSYERLHPDDFKILAYLQHYEKTNEMEPCTLDFIEWMLMYTTMTFTQFLEMMNGAYIIIAGDKGTFHKHFYPCHYDIISIPKVSFTSSRRVRVPFTQYDVQIPVSEVKNLIPMSSHDNYLSDAYRMGTGILFACDDGSVKASCKKNDGFEILIGRSKAQGLEGDSAFQFEEYNMASYVNLLLHGVTFAKYKYMKQNVGALGFSKYTDKNPLVIPVCKRQFGKQLVACFNTPLKRTSSSSQISTPFVSALSSPARNNDIFETVKSRQTRSSSKSKPRRQPKSSSVFERTKST